MTENKQYSFNVNKNTIEFDGKFKAYVNIVDGQRIVDLLNELHEENKKLKQVNEMLSMDFANSEHELFEENEKLKAQLYCDDEEGVCNICKHHYLVKDEEGEFGYYNSRCKKGHYECAKVFLKHCEDFEKELQE